MESPILMVCGEAPGGSEDEAGEPFVGKAGQTLRAVLRDTGVLDKGNTLISNVLKCRPPGNKFPTDGRPAVCVSKWLSEEIRIAAPKRILLLGNVPLKYLVGMQGITKVRGTWLNVRGIRAMATYHPSYVCRQDGEGDVATRENFEADISEVAGEVRDILGQVERF